MGMINCKECGYRLSDKAKACPNCGAPIEVANPPKKAPVKKKWWEKDCNGWKFTTLIVSFLFVIFFIAFLSKLGNSSVPTPIYEKKRKFLPDRNDSNFSFSPPRSSSFVSLFKKDLNAKEIEKLEKKHKKMMEYFKDIKSKENFSYRKILKFCDIMEEYGKELKIAKKMGIKFDNNKTVDDLLEREIKFQKAVFPRLRKLYAKAVKMKFFAILRSAAGGKRKKKIIFEATIFANEREIDKFHKIILGDLKKLRFNEAIYVLEKRLRIRGVKETISERKGIVYEIDSPSDSDLP